MTRSPTVFDWRDADAITGRSIWVGGVRLCAVLMVRITLAMWTIQL